MVVVASQLASSQHDAHRPRLRLPGCRPGVPLFSTLSSPAVAPPGPPPDTRPPQPAPQLAHPRRPRDQLSPAAPPHRAPGHVRGVLAGVSRAHVGFERKGRRIDGVPGLAVVSAPRRHLVRERAAQPRHPPVARRAVLPRRGAPRCRQEVVTRRLTAAPPPPQSRGICIENLLGLLQVGMQWFLFSVM